MWSFLALIVACGGSDSSAVSSDCQDLCHELVVSCAYDAYPDDEACLQGCAWNESKGEDVKAMYACVQSADDQGACDTFAVLECEHQYGPTDTGSQK